MNKYLIIIVLLIALYLYWKYQPSKTLPLKPEDIIERKDKPKEVYWDASDFDINSNNE